MLSWGRSKEPEKGKSLPESREFPSNPRSGHGADAARRQASAPAPATESLENVLLTEGGVAPEKMQEALARQREEGGFLGQILMDMGIIAEGSLTSILARYCKIPHLSLLDYLIDERIVELVPREICLKYRLLPIDKLGRNLTLAMVNPLDAEARRVVQERCPDLRIKPILCANAHFEAVVRRVFGDEAPGTEPEELSASSFGLKSVKPKAPPEAPASASAEEEPRPVEQGASDAIVDSCFGEDALDTDVPGQDAAGIAPEPEAPDPDDTSLMMRQMVSAMRSSMKETYSVLSRRVPTFNGLRPETVAKVFAKGATREFQPGEVIFSKGDSGDELYIVLSGAVRIVDGERELATLEQGGLFGEMALFSKAPRSATAVACEATSLLALSEEAINSVVPPEAAMKMLVNIIAVLSDRLRRANEGG